MADLLALSFLQPWLWAILEEHKGVRVGDRFFALENRKWRPPARVLGQRIALHASAGWDEDGEEFVDEQLILDADPRAARYFESPPRTACVRGAIVGTATVLGAVGVVFEQGNPAARRIEVPPIGPVDGSLWEAAGTSPWAFGRWVWILTDLRKLPETITARGMLGLWRVPPDIAARVRALGAA